MEQQIKDVIDNLNDEDFLELKDYVAEVYSRKQVELERKQAEKVMKDIRIGANVLVSKGGRQVEALVVAMDMDKITFEAKEYERRQSVKYADVVRIL